jgi:hypothetical protein
MAETTKRSLYEDLMEPRTDSNTNQCKMAIIMSDMDDKDAEALNRAVELVRTDRGQGRSKVYSSSWITQILRKHGHSVSISTVQRHIIGVCPCGRIGE